jgi:hypothetical protein
MRTHAPGGTSKAAEKGVKGVKGINHPPLRTPHGDPAHWDALQYETAIVWAPGFDPATVRYVREKYITCQRRRGRIAWWGHAGRLVGWANVSGEMRATNGHFSRRMFWLNTHDAAPGQTGPYDNGGGPVEAVDPRSIVPGVPGELTERAWGMARGAKA